MSILTCAIAVAYLAILVWAVRRFARDEGLYSTILVFGIPAFIYYVGIPVEMALFEEEIRDVGDYVFLSPSLQAQVALMGLLAFIAFVVGYRVSGFRPFPSEDGGNALPSPAPRMPRSLVFFAVGAVASLGLLFGTELRLMMTYEGAYETAYTNPAMSFLLGMTVLAIAMCAAIIVRRGKWRHWLAGGALASLLFTWGVMSSNKDPLLILLLAMAAFFVGKRSKRRGFLLGVVAAATILMLLLPLFSLYRAGLTLPECWDAYYFGLTRSDPRGPMISLASVTEDDQPFAWGETYLRNAYMWIPRFIWPNRPLDMAEIFARDHIAGWAPGQGLGYSLLAEAYLNFGWFGILLQYFVIGLLWGKVWKLVQRIVQPVNPAYWMALYSVLGFYLLILMHRGATTATTKTLLMYLLPLALLFYVFDGRRAPCSDPVLSSTTAAEEPVPE